VSHDWISAVVTRQDPVFAGFQLWKIVCDVSPATGTPRDTAGRVLADEVLLQRRGADEGL